MLKKDGVVVYAVQISEGEAPESIVTITSSTGGEVFTPGDPEALRRVFQTIDEMQKTRIEKVRAERIDDYDLLARAGLAFLAAALLVLFGLRYTPW